MSVLAIVAIVLAVLLLVLFVGGSIAAQRRARRLEPDLRRRVAQADRALESARAQDRGWDRVLLEQAARSALEAQRPDFRYDQLHLVRVEDRPGKDEDRAHMAAVGEGGERAEVVLERRGGEWAAARVD